MEACKVNLVFLYIGRYKGSMWETIQKFGLEYCDLPTILWNVEVMLRVVGVKIVGVSKSIPKIYHVVASSTLVIYFFCYVASMLAFVIVDCRETGDILAGVMVLSVSMTSLIGVNKLLYMCSQQKKVQSLVASYIAYDRLPLTPATSILMAKMMRNVKTRLLLCIAVTMGNDFVFNLQPLVDIVLPSGLNLYDKHVVYGLKYMLGISNYPVAVICIIICSTFICYATSTISGLLIVTTGYSEGRLLSHSQELRELWSDALGHYRENFDLTYTGNSIDRKATAELNKYIKRRLHLIVESHAINIDLIKKIEDVFRYAILVEFILLTACLITDLLGGLEDTFIILPYALMQVGMDCYVGQKLMDASIVFENAVYDCKWENFDVNNRKTVLLILKMSQKTLSLSAGGVATLNFTTLMAMYKSVFSAYTTLRSTML